MQDRKNPSRATAMISAGYRSVEFAAEYTGLSRKSISRRISDGSLPAYQVGGTRTIRLKVEDIDALMIPIEG